MNKNYLREEFDKNGYHALTSKCLIAMPYATEDMEKDPRETHASEEPIQLKTGTLTKEEAEAILNALPIDVTFVDKTDAVRYFNKPEKRIFVRTRSVIGTKVQQCHPKKSVHIVNKILDGFKAGKKDSAEFWIRMEGRLVHIRYLPVRGMNGQYIGTLEVTQDITAMKEIEGEKRLLDLEE